MSITLYYFSATGNSLTTARILAQELGDCRLVPVAAVQNQPKIVEENNTVGFVFPVYYGEMPYPVREAISKMVFPADSYVFAVNTYRGHGGAAPQRLDALLRTRGQKLSLAGGVPMPGNSFINAPEKDAAYLQQQEENIKTLIPAIRNREVQNYFSEEVLPLRPVSYPNNFRGITADDNCIGCGRCVSVCPMNNISLQNGKALIGDNCATCLACFHWCPVEAIWMSKKEEMWDRMGQDIARRSKYQHPQVTFSDITAQKN